jgi:hypothetical protein
LLMNGALHGWSKPPESKITTGANRRWCTAHLW